LVELGRGAGAERYLDRYAVRHWDRCAPFGQVRCAPLPARVAIPRGAALLRRAGCRLFFGGVGVRVPWWNWDAVQGGSLFGQVRGAPAVRGI